MGDPSRTTSTSTGRAAISVEVDMPAPPSGGTVDVVIPMRNGAATIARAVASVLGQTLLPERILVVDDGSTDGGGELVRGLPRVEVITTPPLGVSHARNTGIRASRAEFIAFLDCDDLWLPDKLRIQLVAFERRPEVVAVNTAFMSVDMNGRRVPGAATPVTIRRDAHRRLLLLFQRGGGGSSTMMARRLALLDEGGFDEALAYGEDRDTWLRLAHGREFDYCPEVLACIVENPQSVTRRAFDDPRVRAEMLMQNLAVVEKWVGRARLPVRLYVNCSSEILIQSVRNRLSYDDLLALRRQLVQRVPRLAARIAPNTLVFLAGLLFSGLANSVSVLRRFLGYKRRRKLASRYGAHYASREAG